MLANYIGSLLVWYNNQNKQKSAVKLSEPHCKFYFFKFHMEELKKLIVGGGYHKKGYQ